jgi:hypothetical protein
VEIFERESHKQRLTAAWSECDGAKTLYAPDVAQLDADSNLLQSHPQLRGGLKKAAQSKSSIGSNGAFAQNYFVQAVERDAKAAGSLYLSEAERLEVFLQQDLPRRNSRTQPIGLSSDLRRRLRRHDRSM